MDQQDQLSHETNIHHKTLISMPILSISISYTAYQKSCSVFEVTIKKIVFIGMQMSLMV